MVGFKLVQLESIRIIVVLEHPAILIVRRSSLLAHIPVVHSDNAGRPGTANPAVQRLSLESKTTFSSQIGMDGATNNYSGPSATEITGDRQTSPAPIETVSRLLFSSDYYRKVDRTTDIAGRLPNAVYTLPPRLVQAIVGRAELSAATREALVAECKKFFLAHREYEESKETFVDVCYNMSTTITLDCGRLYSEGHNRQGQCGIGSKKSEVIGPRLIHLPPVLEVWHCKGRWLANTTRGLYAWGYNYNGNKLGVGNDEYVRQPRCVLIGDVLDVYMLPLASFFRSSSGWFGCGDNLSGQLGMGHTDAVTTPTPIPGSERVTRWRGSYVTSFGFSDDGLLACGENIYGQCGVGSTEQLTTLTPVALPDDFKGRVDRVVCDGGSTLFITGRRCFAVGANHYGQLGLGLDDEIIPTPTELPIPVDDVIAANNVTVIRSGDTLLACGSNDCRMISTTDIPKVTTPTPLDLPGPVVKVTIILDNVFIQLLDGAWVGQGQYDSDYFTPVPEADLIEGRILPGWSSVIDDNVEELNAREADVNLMFLPEPIANT